MRIIWIGLVLTTSAAWASEPPQSTSAPAPDATTAAPAAPVAAAAAAPATATPPASSKGMTVQQAQKAGYKIVNENGKTVYCRDQLKTGSRLRKETICLTAEELEAAREASRRNMDQMQRAIAPPQGT